MQIKDYEDSQKLEGGKLNNLCLYLHADLVANGFAAEPLRKLSSRQIPPSTILLKVSTMYLAGSSIRYSYKE